MNLAFSRLSLPSLRLVLLLDAIFEFVAGAALIVFAGTLGDWLGIAPPIVIALGVVFIAAGAAIQVLRATSADDSLFRGLALANVIGGAAGWVVLFVFWRQLEPGGRAVLGSASDLVIIIGLLEFSALRSRVPG